MWLSATEGSSCTDRVFCIAGLVQPTPVWSRFKVFQWAPAPLEVTPMEDSSFHLQLDRSGVVLTDFYETHL